MSVWQITTVASRSKGPRRRLPHRTRFIVLGERPHRGAQLSLFDSIEGIRHQVMATDTPPGNGSDYWRPATPTLSKIASALAKTVTSACSHQLSSRSTRHGSNSPSRASTCSPGPSTCSWTATSPQRNRRNCGTDSCTSRRVSPAQPGEPGCGSPQPGPQVSPQRSPASPRDHNRSADTARRNPTTASGHHHAHPPNDHHEDQQTGSTALIHCWRKTAPELFDAGQRREDGLERRHRV